MIPVLDTSILVEMNRGKKETQVQIANLLSAHLEIPYITFPTVVEFLEEIQAKNMANQELDRKFLTRFPQINTDNQSAEVMAKLRCKYSKKGIHTNIMDLMIASLVIANNMMLITRDKDFERIDELKKIILD